MYVDSVVDLVSGKSIDSIKAVSYNEWFFPCHFPGNPVVPGVIQLESIFQSAAIIISTLPENIDKGKTVYINSVKNANFFKEVRPGSVMKIRAELLKDYRRGLARSCYGKIEVDGELVCEAYFSMIIKSDLVKIG